MEGKYEKETWSGDFTANQQPAVTVWNWNIRSRGVCFVDQLAEAKQSILDNTDRMAQFTDS